MEAHASDLRAEVGDERLVDALRRNWREASLDAKTASLLAFAEKLTLHPSGMGEGDVKALREAGWSDREIHDASQVAAYFNYINRIADSLGVDLEPGMPAPGA